MAKSYSKKGKSIQIPAYILQDRSLSVLEKIVEFLKEDKSLTYHEIAVLLHRDDRTIWTVYRRTSLKRKKISRQEAESSIKKTKQRISVPSKVFEDRTLSVLEVLAEYLQTGLGMTYHEIAVLLGRDDRTIWTVCNRGRKKRNG